MNSLLNAEEEIESVLFYLQLPSFCDDDSLAFDGDIESASSTDVKLLFCHQIEKAAEYMVCVPHIVFPLRKDTNTVVCCQGIQFQAN